MARPFKSVLRVLAILTLSTLVPGSQSVAVAQEMQYDANCNPATFDEGQQFQAEVCSAHIGCRMVLTAARLCGRTKSFLKKIGDLFTLRPTLSNADVMDAATDDYVLTPSARAKVVAARSVASSSRPLPAGSDARSGAIYVNASKDVGYFEGPPGAVNATGAGTLVLSSGKMSRGLFKDGTLDGPGEMFRDGEVRAGTFRNSTLEGEGFVSGVENGKRYTTEGTFKAGKPDGMATTTFENQSSVRDRWANGTRVARGAVAVKGQVPLDPKTPEQLAADAAAAEDAAFAQKLAAAPNAGALFALGDEMAEKGKPAQARQAMRSLLTRFPNSPLAARAADQLAGQSSGSNNGLGAPQGGSVAGSASAATINRGYRFVVPDPVLPSSFYQQYSGHNLSVAECTRQADALNTRVIALRNRYDHNSSVEGLRVVITMTEAGLVLYRQCEDTPGAIPGGDQQMNAWIAARAQALINCRQLASDQRLCVTPMEL